MLIDEARNFNREVFIEDDEDFDTLPVLSPAEQKALEDILAGNVPHHYRLVTKIEGEPGIILASENEQDYMLWTREDDEDIRSPFMLDGERYAFDCPITEHIMPGLYALACQADR